MAIEIRVNRLVKLTLCFLILGLVKAEIGVKKSVVVGNKDVVLAVDDSPVQSMHLINGVSSSMVNSQIPNFSQKVKMQDSPTHSNPPLISPGKNGSEVPNPHQGLQIFLYP